jgi:hypothetical protein
VAMQRCGARGWSPDYIDHRGDLAREALGSIDIAWNRDSWQHLRSTAQVANTRLCINLTNASLTPTDAYRFALHEVLGHALKYASLAGQAESNEVDWPRLFSIHGPHQVLFEGLGQVLPLMPSLLATYSIEA